MSHHSTDRALIEDMLMPPDRSHVADAVQKHLDKHIGPTHTFPHGRLSPDDEGGLTFAIARIKDTVVIDFGKPIRSIGFTAADAMNLSRALRDHAYAIVGKDDAER